MDQAKRDRVVRLVREMLGNTIENGCTPGEAAKFAAKAAEWIEKYEIEEAELRVRQGGDAFSADDMEVCQATIRTGKKVFNPGTTAVIQGLATGSCCKVILLHQNGEAIYGIVGDRVDADYVVQIASGVVPALQIMGRLEGVEHGHEKAGLVRWLNQYLMGAGAEIRRRLEEGRKRRSDHKAAALGGHAPPPGCTALAVVTGEAIAAVKREVVAGEFKKMYPKTRTTHSNSRYDDTARRRGGEAGKRVGLHVGLKE